MERFIHAARGLVTTIRTQRSAQWHTLATGAVAAAGFWYELNLAEWRWICFAVAGVWTAESMNTGIEFLGDALTAKQHPLVGKAKDVAAGGVLVAAIGAAAIGMSIFLPRILPSL